MQLSPQDAQFLFMETDAHLLHVTTVALLEPKEGGESVRFEDMVRHLQRRLTASPIFKQRLVRVPGDLDYPYWAEDKHFDLDYHVQYARLPAPGDWGAFTSWLSELHSRPMDMRRPLWEAHFLDGFAESERTPPGTTAVIFRIHHTAMDGAALIRFMTLLADVDAKGAPAADLAPVEPSKPRPSDASLLLRAAVNGANLPGRFARDLVRHTPALGAVARERLLSPPTKEAPSSPRALPVTRFDGEGSPHKTFGATRFLLSELTPLRSLIPGATLNDVVLAVVSGGLRRYLTKHGELPDESLVAWIPINARSKGAESTGNNIAATTAPLHTNVDDPLERFGAIHKATQRAKSGKSGIASKLLTSMTQNIPAFGQHVMRRLVLDGPLRPHLCNLFVSNVPGPKNHVYMAGARVTDTYGLAPLGPGMGLFIGTPSYAGSMTFNVISNKEMLPDVEFFIDCLREARDELAHRLG